MSKRQGMGIMLLLICIPLMLFFMYGGPAWLVAPQSDVSKQYVHSERQETQQRFNQGSNTESSSAWDPPKAEAKAPSKPPANADSAPASRARLYDDDNDDDDEYQKPVAKAAAKPAQSKGWLSSSQSSSKGNSEIVSERWPARPQLEKSLAKVINLLPGEMESRDLLRGVDGTGKEKLRELGLRVRAFKGYFEAWEDLHLSIDAEGATYVRDDVVQYLRNQENEGGSIGNAIAGLEKFTVAQVIRSYEAYRYFLAKFGTLLFPWTSPFFADHMTLHSHFRRGGRGIVLTAGDDQAPYLLTTIYTFRKLGCNLPIEVMYLGDSDLSEDFRAELEELDGVVTRDIAQMVNDEGWRLAGWAAKPFAILYSSFREVIFIDADSLFFENPEILFEDPDYQDTGALFFRDRLIMPEKRKRFLQQILPKPISRKVKQSRFWTGQSGHMQESGVVVVDKWRHFMALLLISRMNGPDRDGNKEEGRVGVYDMVYGDKETFWIGFELASDTDYSFHQGDAGIMGVLSERRKPHPDDPPPSDGEATPEPPPPPPADSNPADNYTICAPQLLHLSTTGKPLWFNGWLLDNKYADKSQKKFGTFTTYLREPRDVRDPGAWQLEEHNSCCLTTDTDKKFEFDEEERRILEMIMARARDVGAPGSQ